MRDLYDVAQALMLDRVERQFLATQQTLVIAGTLGADVDELARSLPDVDDLREMVRAELDAPLVRVVDPGRAAVLEVLGVGRAR